MLNGCQEFSSILVGPKMHGSHQVFSTVLLNPKMSNDHQVSLSVSLSLKVPNGYQASLLVLIGLKTPNGCHVFLLVSLSPKMHGSHWAFSDLPELMQPLGIFGALKTGYWLLSGYVLFGGLKNTLRWLNVLSILLGENCLAVARGFRPIVGGGNLFDQAINFPHVVEH